MSSPYAEGGPLPPVNRERLAAHERRLDEWAREQEADVWAGRHGRVARARQLVEECTAADKDLAALRGTVLSLVAEVLTRPSLSMAVRVVEAHAIISAGHEVEQARIGEL